MRVDVKTTPAQSFDCEALVFTMFEGSAPTEPRFAPVDSALDGLFGRLIGDQRLKGRSGEFELTHSLGRVRAERICVLGMGKRDQLDLKRLGDALMRLGRKLRGHGVQRAALVLPALDNDERDAQIAVEALSLVASDFERYLQEPRGRAQLEALTLLAGDEAQAEAYRRGCRRGEAVAAGMALARELADEPANVATPSHLAERARLLAEQHQLGYRVLEQAEMEELGMGALLGVARGSAEPPKLIILERPGAGDAPLVYVGKGITFDSGGISIKPRDKMWYMKYDMAGGAAVLGSMLALAKLECPQRVVALVPACENLPSGTALKPGDIVRSLAGLSVEITNTDAEGRLILADALAYARREYTPRAMVDVATLTGACVIALGDQAIGLMGSDDELLRQLQEAGAESGERLWQLPLWSEYAETMRSTHADLRNSGSPSAGAITAAAFLSRFVDDTPWAHLDIAGTAWVEGDSEARALKGATGSGVRTLVAYAMRSSQA